MVKLKKLNEAVEKIEQKAMPILTTAGTICMMTYPIINTFAAGDAKGLITTIFEIVAKLIIVLGVVLAVLGLVHYAAAYSEGDGPAKQKAVMQIAAGAMVILLGALLSSTYASKLADYIETS